MGSVITGVLRHLSTMVCTASSALVSASVTITVLICPLPVICMASCGSDRSQPVATGYGTLTPVDRVTKVSMAIQKVSMVIHLYPEGIHGNPLLGLMHWGFDKGRSDG